MSNEEHLFENAIIALENKESYDKWLETETKYYNTLGVSEEVIEVIWHLAIYTVYTHNPALEYDYNSKAIPIEWIKKYIKNHTYEMVNPKYVDDTYNYIKFTEKPFDYNLIVMPVQVKAMLADWEKENDS